MYCEVVKYFINNSIKQFMQKLIRRMFIPFGCDTDLKQRIGNIEGKNPRFLLPKYVYVLSRLIYHHTYTPERYEQNGVPFNIKTLARRLGESDCDTKVIISNLVENYYP